MHRGRTSNRCCRAVYGLSHQFPNIMSRPLPLALLAFQFALPAAAQYDAEHLSPVADAQITDRFACEKLRLYPIIGDAVFHDAHKEIGRTVPMNKALQDGRLKINEHTEGATVNTLQATNTSGDTIYMMQGEVVVGGKQDRMLAQDVLIAPGATLDIGAFCVEHGRWTENGSGANFTTTVGFAAQDVRKVAAVEQEQSRVWEEVEGEMRANNAPSSTGSYAHLMNDKEFQAERLRYRERLKDLPASCIGIVGVIAVSGDRVIGCDILATEELFRQAYLQLIDAYIAEALGSGAPVSMTTDEVRAHFETLFADESELERKISGNGSLFKAGGRTYRVTTF